MLDLRMLRYADWRLLLAALLLIIFSFFLIFSATSALHIRAGGDSFAMVKKQFISAIVAFAIFSLFLYLDYDRWRRYAWVIYGGVLLLLLLVLFKGNVAQGAQRWLALGPLSFQPSELAKLGLIIALARFLEGRQGQIQTVMDVVPVALFLLPPFALVFLQPDLGTALVLILVTGGMLLWAGIPPILLLGLMTPLFSVIASFSIWIWLLYLVLLGTAVFLLRPTLPEQIFTMVVNILTGLASPRVWHVLKPYQRDRILTFLNPEHNPLGAGYHIYQSKIAVGAGGILGRGFLQGTQTQLQFIPEQWTDFIFSVVAEEWGLIGSLIVLGLFFVILLRILQVASNARESFGGLLAFGLGSWIAAHLFMNVAMVIGLAPVVGVPLPFISYGGTALLTGCMALGILGSVAMRGHKLLF